MYPFRVLKTNEDGTIKLLTTDWLGYHYIYINEKPVEISDPDVKRDREKATALFNKLCAEHEIEEMKRTGTILAG